MVGDSFKLGRDLLLALKICFSCWVENTEDGVTKAAPKDACWDRYCIRRYSPEVMLNWRLQGNKVPVLDHCDLSSVFTMIPMA